MEVDRRTLLTAADLPPAARSYVRAFVGRQRAVGVLRAVGAGASVLAVVVFAACLADRWLRFPEGGRWALLLGAITAAAATTVRGLVVALRPCRLFTIAGRIEHRTPAFGQRLLTVASARDASPQLLAKLLAEVDAIAARRGHDVLGPGGLTPWRAAGWAWAGAAAVVCAVAVTWPINSVGMPRLLARLAHPGRRLEPVTITLLDVSPRGLEVSQGEAKAVTINAIASGAHAATLGARGVEIYLSTDGRHWSHAAMNPVSLGAESARFEFVLPVVDRDLSYYVRGGDASSDTYQIKVKRVPSVAEFHLRYTYPTYTHHAPTSAANNDGLIEALVGCEATVTIVATEPLASAELTVGTGFSAVRYPMTPAPTNRPTDWQVKVPVTQDATCAIDLISAANVAGHGPSPMLMRALPDREPAVVIDQPAADVRLSPADPIALRFRAGDDYGLASLEAVVQVNSGTDESTFALPVTPRALRRQGEFTFDLSDLDAKVGDVVTFTVRARDATGQVGASEARRVLVAPVSVGAAAHARAAELRRAAVLAGAWVESLTKAKAALDAARAAEPRGPRQQELWTAAGRALANAGDAAVSLRQSLLRTLVRTNAPGLARTIAALADDAVGQVLDAGHTVSAANRTDDALAKRVEAMSARARVSAAALGEVSQAEQAAVVLSELEDVKAVSAAPRADDKADADLRAAAVASANRTINDGLRRLGLQRAAPNLPELLKARARRGRDTAAARRIVDLNAAVTEWVGRLKVAGASGTELPARLGVAAQVEAFRPDGDLVLARDLRLASRAAAALAAHVSAARDAERARTKGRAVSEAALAKVFEPLGQYQEACASLFRDRATIEQADRVVRANAARDQLGQWSGLGVQGGDPSTAPIDLPEDLAFEAAAAAVKEGAERAAQFDARLVEEIARSSQDDATRYQDDAARARDEAARVERLRQRQADARATLAGAPAEMEDDALAALAAAQAGIASDARAMARVGDAAPPADSQSPAAWSTEAPSALVTLHHPMLLAAWHARQAAAALGAVERPTDRKAILASQSAALEAMSAAHRRSIRRAAVRRFEAVPAFAPLFQTFPADEPAAPAVAGGPARTARWHDWFPGAAGSPDLPGGGATPARDPGLSGYQDQLKAYWDALSKAQDGGKP